METTMPRYIVERDFPDGLQVPIDDTGARACLAVIDSNLADQVTWVHSYVSLDKKKTFCVYDGPSPEAIRRTAGRSNLPGGGGNEGGGSEPLFAIVHKPPDLDRESAARDGEVPRPQCRAGGRLGSGHALRQWTRCRSH